MWTRFHHTTITAGDFNPLYRKQEAEPPKISNRRIKRRLTVPLPQRSCDHCRCNGAANILRKVITDVWNKTEDCHFLAAPEMSGLYKLNPKSISIKGIVAA
jgi:hypothetical protein